MVWSLDDFYVSNRGCLHLLFLVGVYLSSHRAVAVLTLIKPATLQAAMKAKDKDRLMTLRNILAALQKESKEEGNTTTERLLLPNEDSVKVLKKLRKMHQEAIKIYRAAGKLYRAEAEEKELNFIQSYLPAQADEAQVRKWAMEAIKLTGASCLSDMGKAMGELMKRHKSDVDGKVAKIVITSLLKKQH